MPLQLKKIPLFERLPQRELDLLSAHLIEKFFRKGEILHAGGNPCGQVFFIESGRVKLYRTSARGKEQIYEILGPGETCACNPGHNEWQCPANAEALSPCTVWYLPRTYYLDLIARNPLLTQSLNELFAERLRRFEDIIEDVTLKDTKRRVIKFLLDSAERKKIHNPGGDVLFIPFTREELSHRLGAARETIARHISELKKLKLIDVKPYQIIILNKEALEKLLQ